MQAEDFPTTPEVDESEWYDFRGGYFRDGVASVIKSAAKVNTRPVLEGVCVEVDGDAFTFAAADGFRLAVYGAYMEEAASQAVRIIMPARAMREITALGKNASVIRMRLNEDHSQALVEVGQGVQLIAQLLGGDYPNYEKLIPEEHTTVTRVGGVGFLRAAQMAALFDPTDSVGIKLSAVDSTLTVSMSAMDGDTVADVDARVEGDPIVVHLSGQYLVESLGVLGQGTIEMSTKDSRSPVLLEAESMRHVMMPRYAQ